jgi:hypothetical protein
MWLPRFIVTTLWFTIGAVLGVLLRPKFGVFGAVIGFFAGTLIAFFITWIFLVSKYLLLTPFPVCRRGNCRSFRGYLWRKGTIYGREKGGVFKYNCKCGDFYLRDGARFMELLTDGKTRPYKIYAKGIWLDDKPRD